MANKLYNETSIQSIANAIRSKNGSTTTYKVDEMANAILDITTKGETIPTYHYVEALEVAQKIDTFKKAHTNNLVFGTITDNHVYANNTTYEALSKASVLHGAFALETVGAMVGADFVANLGDNCWENGSDTDNAYQGSLYTVNVTKPMHERLTSFSLVGNHDKNDSTQTIYDLIGQYNDFDVRPNTQIRSFGYKDFTSKKVRVIALNTCDYLNASGGCALSYEQKDFLMRALDLSSKSDFASWGIILLSHIPLDWNGGDYNFYTDLQAILSAYENGTTASITVNSSYALNETPSGYATYSSGKLVYNYSGKNSARIIANIHGHVHTDVYGKLANLKTVRMASPNTCFYLGKTESYPDYGDYSISTAISRTANTVTDTSATFYCIDLDAQDIYSYSFGAGNDRATSYKEVISYYPLVLNLSNCITETIGTTVNVSDNSQEWLIRPNDSYKLPQTVTVANAQYTWEVDENTGEGILTLWGATNTVNVSIIATYVAPYTNIIDSVGTVDNVRLRSGGATGSASGFASNYFQAKGGDIIRVYFPNGNRASIPSNGVYCCTYTNTSGTLVTAYDGSTSSTVLKNVTDKGYEIHIPSSVNCSYARVAGGPNGAYAGWIVTVNEEIV